MSRARKFIQEPPKTLSIRQGKGAGTGTAAYNSVEEVAHAKGWWPLVDLTENGEHVGVFWWNGVEEQPRKCQGLELGHPGKL